MTSVNNHVDLIPYDELFHILHTKFRATHHEIRYWVKKSLDYVNAVNLKNQESQEDFEFCLDESVSLLFPYATDLPYLGMLQSPPDNFFYPECYFYQKKFVNSFFPEPHLRFVYQKDLTGLRNWNDYKINDPRSFSMVSQTLLKANEYGILKFYNLPLHDFTTHANKLQIWCQTFEGEAYAADPDSFFLLYEILNVERVFFKKDRDECLKELGEKAADLPQNVYKFNKK
jgi:hypothetical protein